MIRDFSDGSQDSYAELPVNVTSLTWRRGDSRLLALAETDPAQFFGGWRAFVNDIEGNPNPIIPLPIVTRAGDGGNRYQVYAAPHILFVPIQHRTRFELREKVKDENGRDRTRILATSKEHIKGYEPNRQIFGLCLSRENPANYAPVLLRIDRWSTYISFDKAGEKYKKIKPQPNTIVVRKYGTNGKIVNGERIPIIEAVGESKYTPIEALGIDKPQFFVITDEVNRLYDQSLDWKNCPRWNATGSAPKEPRQLSPLERFVARAEELGLDDSDMQQVLAANNNDYLAALKDIEPVDTPHWVPDSDEENIPF